MEAITVVKPPKETQRTGEDDGVSGVPDWESMYKRQPEGNKTLFELEASVAKRMEFLAWIDQVLTSPQSKGYEAMLDEIGARLPEERRSRYASAGRPRGTVLGSTDDAAVSSQRSRSRSNAGASTSAAYAIVFEPDEDLLSFRLACFAFCMSERWRKWFVRVEEMLLRSRMKMEMSKKPFGFLEELLRLNNLPCTQLSVASLQDDPVLQEYIDYRRQRADAQKDSEGKVENYYSVPLSLAIRLVKTRQVLCRRGQAILFRDQVQEVFLTLFRAQVGRSLHEAYLARMKQQHLDEDTEKSTVMQMLDAFLEQFIADPTDNLQQGLEGSVRAGDVQYLAQTHFPLCMRQVDQHLRREGHLKHNGRFSYGLFLKAIGLSLEDSIALFATLMTQKGGGSAEAFSKTAYGYNVRHNYGLEGKKTSYSSLSCGTLLNMPPTVDKNDCHGCPFRFRNEAGFRAMLSADQHNPRGKDFKDVHPAAADIEDIVQDCKSQHYTRACYKYFMATHPDARRDTLFRSPYEYYCVSQEYEAGGDVGASPDAGVKRTSAELSPSLREDAVRPRTSE